MSRDFLGDLTRALDADEWPAVILVTGEDEHGRASAVQQIVSRVPRSERATSIDRFDGDALHRALDAARTPSLLGGRRVVVASGVAGLDGRASKDAQEVLLRYLEAPTPHTTLVLVSPKADGRRSLVKTIARVGLAVTCGKPKEREMPALIEKLAAEHRLEISAGAVQAIADAVGNDVALAEREMEKIALATASHGQKIASPKDETIEELLRPGRAVGAFALEDAMLAGDRRNGARLLKEMLRSGMAKEPLALLARLSSITRRLSVASDVVCRGGSERDVQQALGCHPFVASKYTRAARTVGGCAGRALAACVTADAELKSGGDPHAALARVVLAFAKHRGARRAGG